MIEILFIEKHLMPYVFEFEENNNIFNLLCQLFNAAAMTKLK